MVKQCSILQCYQEQDNIAQIQYAASKDFLTSGINNAKLNSRHMEEWNVFYRVQHIEQAAS